MDKELVSVVVITYNSEKWILETLESIKNQTYKNLEIIITDDSSNDKTIEISKKWIKENEKRFIRIKILESTYNQGLVKNLNKGIKVAKSNWIKLIAGDDILIDSCIEKNINYCKEKNYNNLFSKMIDFKNELNEENFIIENKDYSGFNNNVEEQFRILCKGNFVLAPTGFFKKKIIEDMNYFDEKYPMVEDYPMWLKITEKGIKLNFLDEYTVYYRVHSNSISNTENKILNEKMYEFRKEIYKRYICKKIKDPYFHYQEKLMWLRNDSILKNGNNRKYTFVGCITYLLDLYYYKKAAKKLYHKFFS